MKKILNSEGQGRKISNSEEIEIVIAKNTQQEKECTVNSIRLHSKYNPQKEALRVIKRQLAEKQIPQNFTLKPKLIFMIGAGLGYELEVLHECFPHSKIFPIFFHVQLYTQSSYREKGLFNPPYSNNLMSSIRNALEISTLGEIDENEILTLYWPTSHKIWPEHTLKSLKEIKNILSMHFAESKTVEHFAAQWIRNACFHYLHINTWNIPEKTNLPIVICAAGPSLNDQIEEIKKKRNHIMLVSVSSALQCLGEHDLYPDLIVHQDSSYYSAKYLIDFPEEHKVFIAHPLHTSRSPKLREGHSIILDTNQETEHLLDIHKDNEHTLQLSSYATVLGTALELSLKLSDNKVYLAGFDLSIDTRSNHCYPHIQNEIHKTNKVHTFYNNMLQKYFSAAHTLDSKKYGNYLKQTESLKIYAHWFASWINSNNHHRCLVLNVTNHPHLSSKIAVNQIHTKTKSKTNTNLQIAKSKKFSFDQRKESLYHLVSTWNQQWTQINQENIEAQIQRPHASKKMNKTLTELKSVLSDSVFHDIVHSVKKYID